MSSLLSKFDPFDGDNIIRITAGLFMFPRVAGKITGYEATLGFFEKAGFHPAPAFLVLAGVMEAVSGLCLVFGLWVRFAAPVAAGALFVAAAALFEVGGFKWVWNKGGFEYPVFWGLICLAIAIKEWLPLLRRWFPRAA
ncbi:DoxX family protein [Siculibacillus lacustris]|uniref:DoxX family protein n=1 Tax=Siculibacillus lacustris TaxID=1549641 RepID=A0A4V2KST9_9HYPH|nr:DoxX family protein [Siculibacillus lacustris]TBW34389.1 DoxX family protein [Siculibacillus lacustris]